MGCDADDDWVGCVCVVKAPPPELLAAPEEKHTPTTPLAELLKQEEALHAQAVHAEHVVVEVAKEEAATEAIAFGVTASTTAGTTAATVQDDNVMVTRDENGPETL